LTFQIVKSRRSSFKQIYQNQATFENHKGAIFLLVLASIGCSKRLLNKMILMLEPKEINKSSFRNIQTSLASRKYSEADLT
jgi:hypothetical protein